jgi:hypothetical protein
MGLIKMKHSITGCFGRRAIPLIFSIAVASCGAPDRPKPLLLTPDNAVALQAVFVNEYSNLINLNSIWRGGPKNIRVISAFVGRNKLIFSSDSTEAFFCIKITAKDADSDGIFTAKEEFYFIGYVESGSNGSGYIVKPFLGGLSRGTGGCNIQGEQQSMPRILSRYPAAKPDTVR